MILSYIRKNQCKRLFYPLMLLGVVIFLVWRSPVTEYVTKRTISNAVLINDSMAKKVLYAKIKTGTLYYSGEDCLAGGELVGHYYYELIGGSCHFYLGCLDGWVYAQMLITTTGNTGRRIIIPLKPKSKHRFRKYIIRTMELTAIGV